MELKMIDLVENADASQISLGGAACLDVDRVKALTLQKLQPRPKKHLASRLLLAAAIAAALAVSALAFAGFRRYGSPKEMLEAFYGNTRQHSVVDQKAPWGDLPDSERVALDEQAAQLVGPCIGEVSQTVREGDCTLTVHGNLYDSVTGCGIVYYTLENPRGIDCRVDYDGMVSGLPVYGGTRHGYAYLLEGNSTDTHLEIAEYYIRGPHDTENYITLGLEITGGTLSQQDEFTRQQKAVEIPLEDGGGMPGLYGSGVRLSPIGMALDTGEMPFLDHGENSDTSQIRTLEIVFQDGSTYVVRDDTRQNYVFSAGFDADHLVMPFNRLVDVEQVTGVSVNGQMIRDLKPIPDARRLRYGPYVDQRGQLDREGSRFDGQIRFDGMTLIPGQVSYSSQTKTGYVDCRLQTEEAETLMAQGWFSPMDAGLQTNVLMRWECLEQGKTELRLRGYFLNLAPEADLKLWFAGSKADPRLDMPTENLVCLALADTAGQGEAFADGAILASDLGLVIDYEALGIFQGSSPKDLSLTLADGSRRILSSWDEEILDCAWFWTGELRDSRERKVYVGFPEAISARTIEKITYGGHSFQR